MKPTLLIVLALLAALTAPAPQAHAQTFTYQGRLDSAGSPADGPHDFQFAIFTLSSGGAQVGLTQQHNSVPVVDGLFTINLTFANAFPGANRFLEVRVRPAGVGGFTTLPRTPITATPYAIKALTENFTLLGDGVSLFNTPPSTRVMLNRTSPVLPSEVLAVTAPTGTGTGGIVINHADASGTPYLFFTTAGSVRASMLYEPASSSVRLSAGSAAAPALTAATFGADARVGVNLTSPPTQTLEVNGTAAANGFLYRANQTRTLTVGPVAFRAQDPSAPGLFGPQTALLNVGETGDIYAPVNLPDGAVVRSIEFLYLDNTSAADLVASLGSTDPAAAGLTMFVSAASTGFSSSPRSTSTTLVAPHTVNGDRAYLLRVQPSTSWQGTITAVRGVRINYTVTTPD
jgi:hypothetical protein